MMKTNYVPCFMLLSKSAKKAFLKGFIAQCNFLAFWTVNLCQLRGENFSGRFATLTETITTPPPQYPPLVALLV